MSPGGIIGWLAGLDPAIWQAVIGGAFIGAGWVVNGRQRLSQESRLRAEQVRDVQQALYAEIRAYRAVLERDDVAAYGESLAERIENEPGFFPMIPTERNDTIFRAIVGTIHILPQETIDPVVLYYSQLIAIGALIEDMRGLDLDRIGPKRAASIYRDYIALKLEAIDLAREAMEKIGAHLGNGISPGSGPSDGGKTKGTSADAPPIGQSPDQPPDLSRGAEPGSPAAGRSVR